MKTIRTIALFFALVASAQMTYAIGADSIIVQFGGSSKMVIQTKDKSGINKIKNYDLNKILRDMATELDSNTRDVAIIINEKNGAKYKKDTLFTFKSDTVETKTNGDVSVSFKDGKIIIVDKEGRRRSISIGGAKTENGKTGTQTETPNNNGNKDGDSSKNDQNDNNNNNDDGEVIVSKTPKGVSKSPRKGFNMNIGVNVYGQNDALKYSTADYDLRAGSSRYFSMGWTRSARFARGESASAFLDFGLDFSWYNLMFDGNNTAQKDASGNVKFPEMIVDGKAVALEKSKLVAPYVNISLMPTIAFKNSPITYISAGPYVGYRIGGYTKTKIAGSKNKDHQKSNLGLNDFRYGVGAEIGLKNFPDLFVNYDLGELFQSGKGPAVRMVSFGIRL